ncbi:MAG: class I SAM-dependent methyltransferase [Patescibacteria group bacterium]
MRNDTRQTGQFNSNSKRTFRQKPNSSWQNVGDWYHKLVGSAGHYYHQHTILPYLKQNWPIKPGESILDLGCGQGVFARFLDNWLDNYIYVGVDLAENLLAQAKSALKNSQKSHYFFKSNAARPLEKILQPTLDLAKIKKFDKIICLLALQNMSNGAGCIDNIGKLLKTTGNAVLIINHPCFRVPRQSGWEVNLNNKSQQRWISHYLTSIKIPIISNPGEENSPVTWSYHHSLQDYSGWFSDAGLTIEKIAELTSDKQSQGKMAKSENRGRAEIPLFMAIHLRKVG